MTADVVRIECQGEVKRVMTDAQEYEAKALIYAAGAGHRKLLVPGEEALAGAGVSYCATCDGAFFRGKTVAVVGGGDTALEDALFLARGCERVYLIHRRDAFRGAKTLQNRVEAAGNIVLRMETAVEEIRGGDRVQAVDRKSVV